MVSLLPIGGELIPGYVTSDLQGGRLEFCKPEAAQLVDVNCSGTPMVRGGALILAGIHYHIVCAGAGVGFTLSQVYDGVSTVLLSIKSQGAGVLSRAASIWRPLATPAVDVGGPTAIDGGYLKLELEGAPGDGSFLEVEVWHHNDTRFGDLHTVLSPVDGDLQF